jgi:hypothetical protein
MSQPSAAINPYKSALRQKRTFAFGCSPDHATNLLCRYGGRRCRRIRKCSQYQAALSHKEINSIEWQTIASHTARRSHQRAAQIRGSLRDLDRGLRSAGVDTVTGAMNVQLAVPALLTSGAAIVAATIHPLVALGGAIAAPLYLSYEPTAPRNRPRFRPARPPTSCTCSEDSRRPPCSAGAANTYLASSAAHEKCW